MIVFEFEIVYSKIVEVFDVFVHFESGRRVLRVFQNFLYNRDVAVVDMRVAYDVYEFADFESAHLRKHMQEYRVLHDVPVVCRKRILTALIEYSVEFVARDVERHRIRAGVEVHFVQILEVVDVGKNASRLRIVFEVVKHPVYLVEFALGIYAFDAELVAVCLADRTRFVSPTVPNMRIEVVDIVALFLPNPQNFVYCGFESGASKRDNGEFFGKVVSVDDTKLFYGVRRRSVEPFGADVETFVAYAFVKNLSASIDKYFISNAHSFCAFCV